MKKSILKDLNKSYIKIYYQSYVKCLIDFLLKSFISLPDKCLSLFLRCFVQIWGRFSLHLFHLLKCLKVCYRIVEWQFHLFHVELINLLNQFRLKHQVWASWLLSLILLSGLVRNVSKWDWFSIHSLQEIHTFPTDFSVLARVSALEE